jgi:RNA polymerase sigma factor (sigma-70 family)
MRAILFGMSMPAFFSRLHRILLRRGNTPADAEDLVQESFLKMHEYCAKGGSVRQPEAFLVRTALRLGMNARRDVHRELYADVNIEDVTFVVDTNPTPDEVLRADQCLERMKAALDAVSARTREVFFMHRLDGLTYAQIARHFAISVSAIEKHIASALVVLANVNDQE